MLVPTNLAGVQIPDGYMLVQQVSSNPNAASNSKPQPAFGKNWNRNQRKRDKREQLAASGVVNPVKSSTPVQSPAAAGVESPKPMVAQPTGAEAGHSSNTHLVAERGGAESESAANHSGYHTDEYARLRANQLALRGQSNLSAEMLLNSVQRLVNYLYSFSKVLASPDPGANFDVIKMWRYARNGAHVIAGGNIINVVIEILFFFKTFGNPVEGNKFVTPALDCIKLHHSLVRGAFLRGWVEKKIIQLPSEEVITRLEAVPKSETWAVLRKFLNVPDNCGQLTARLPQSVFQPCYKFVGNSDEPRTLCDVYNMGTSTRYNKALNTLVMHVQNPHNPLLGTNQINALVKGTGISLTKFTGFAQVEGRAAQGKDYDSNYPSPTDLLNLCGLPLPAQEQAEEIQLVISLLIEKIDHLINVQIQTSQQIEELRNLIMQTSCVNRAVTAILPDPMVEVPAESIDSLLADEEGQDMEQERPVTQLLGLNADQVYGADYMTPPPAADILAMSVDSMMADDDVHEQEQ